MECEVVLKVVSLPKVRSLSAQRAEALFGPAPVLTFQPDASDSDTCCSIRLFPGGDESWFGLARDKALFTDRVRMGMKPRFVVHADADTPTVCGDAEVRILARIPSDGSRPTDLSKTASGVLDAILADSPFAVRDAVLVEVLPRNVRVDEGDAPQHGAIPRT